MWTSDGIQVGEGVVGYKIRGTTDWHSEDHKETGCVTKTKSAQQHKWLQNWSHWWFSDQFKVAGPKCKLLFCTTGVILSGAWMHGLHETGSFWSVHMCAAFCHPYRCLFHRNKTLTKKHVWGPVCPRRCFPCKAETSQRGHQVYVRPEDCFSLQVKISKSRRTGSERLPEVRFRL